MKFLRGLLWVYLVVYTLFQLLMMVMEIYTGPLESSIVAWWALLAVPAVVLFKTLKGKDIHWLFHVIGIVALLKIVLSAHQFSSVDGVMLGMYAWFVPMLLVMFFLSIKRLRSAT